jgi:hypothetical protein
MGIDFSNDIVIQISGAGTSLLDCRPPVASQIRQKSSITRLGVDTSTNQIDIMTVSVL